MSGFAGFTLSCDRHDCSDRRRGDDEGSVRAAALAEGWTVVHGRDYCSRCSRKRAERKKLSEVVPADVALLDVWAACRAAGFVVEGEEGSRVVSCCGQEVETVSFLGDAYRAHCKTCGRGISDVTGPVFGNGHVNLIDSDLIDTETPERWVVAPTTPQAAEVGE